MRNVVMMLLFGLAGCADPAAVYPSQQGRIWVGGTGFAGPYLIPGNTLPAAHPTVQSAALH